MKKTETISKEDLDFILVTDSIVEAITFIKNQSITRYELIAKHKHLPIKWLFENS